MIPQAIGFGTLAFGAILGLGAVEQSNWMIGVGGVGMGSLQLIVMYMIQPIKNDVAELKTQIAIIKTRCGDHFGSQWQGHRTPRPLDDTPT